ncbi:hypothetical protein JYT83_01445 [bacterium AH-315-F18]|nr:hypothetical protein [bacterium AH-315-F18]
MTTEISVIGVYRMSYSEDFLVAETKTKWGDPVGKKFVEARKNTKEQFDQNYIVEIKAPKDFEIDFIAFTQENPVAPRESWQVPYSEERIGLDSNTWAFFFSFIDFERQFLYLGQEVPIPRVEEFPEHLKDMAYLTP